MSSRIIEIADAQSGSTARIAVDLGFNCFSWRPVFEEGPREMLWTEPGFTDGGKWPSGSGVPLLFPFPGRIAGGKFSFAGRDYRLELNDPMGNALHGFVCDRPWRVVEQSGPRVVGEFQASVDDRSILERWPADFLIQVSYEVRGRELVSKVHYENCGDGPLPCGFATHAYFRLPLSDGTSAEETLVTVPAEQYWELDRMIPTGRVLPADGALDLASRRPLAGRQFDTAFTNLHADSDGAVRTRLVDPRTGRALTQTFDPLFRQCVVYTPSHREAICLEPYTCTPDAVNLAATGPETGLQIVEPGGFVKTTILLEVS